MNLLLVFSVFLFSTVFLNTSLNDKQLKIYAEEFYLEYSDGKKYLHNFEIKNGSLTDKGSLSDSMIFTVNGTDAELNIFIPKTVPFQYSNQKYESLFVVLDNGEQINHNIVSRTCDFEFIIPFDGYSDIEIVVPYLLTGLQTTYMELPNSCLEDPKYNTEIQQKLKEKQCKNYDFQRGFNLRDEIVCVSPDSYTLLMQRGYLKTFPVMEYQ